jgi:hypothetical protein
MKKWILKALIQKAISWLPDGHRINYLFQQYVTKGVRLTNEYLEDKLIHFSYHRRFFAEGNLPAEGKTVLELGAGWYPIVPVCFFLEGAERIITVDIVPFLSAEKVRQALMAFVRLKEEGRLQQYVEPLASRWGTLEDLCDEKDLNLPALLERLHIRYLVADARSLPLESDSIDLISSNNTFEHIYPEILEDILLEFKRVLRPGGMMSHFIDMSDHFAHLDNSITIYNFLRFSERQWSLIDNSIQPQNRWRLLQYRALYEKLDIPIHKEENRPGDLAALRSVPVHSEFSKMGETELAISHSYLVSGPF